MEPQTAIIWSILSLKLQLSDDIQLQLGDAGQRAKFTQKSKNFPTWIITDLFIKLF